MKIKEILKLSTIVVLIGQTHCMIEGQLEGIAFLLEVT